jgi:EARP and GARP complex-interacting protein 1
MGDGKKVISLADSHILLWDLQPSSSQAVVSKKGETLTGCLWNCSFWLDAEYTS